MKKYKPLNTKVMFVFMCPSWPSRLAETCDNNWQKPEIYFWLSRFRSLGQLPHRNTIFEYDNESHIKKSEPWNTKDNNYDINFKLMNLSYFTQCVLSLLLSFSAIGFHQKSSKVKDLRILNKCDTNSINNLNEQTI